METDPGSAFFWDDRYRAGKTPWDFHGIPSRLNIFLNSVKGLKVFIPGCGSGYEIGAFLNAGSTVTALDFSAAAVERALAIPANREATILHDDFFREGLHLGPFDVVYERTFLCALAPVRWPEYVNRMHKWLGPEGRLVGFFFYGVEADPPPYPLTQETANQLFQERFTLSHDEAVSDSLPLFAGRERWQEWRKSG